MLLKRESKREIEKKIQSNIRRNRQQFMTLLSTSMFTNIKNQVCRTQPQADRVQVTVQQEGGSYCKRKGCVQLCYRHQHIDWCMSQQVWIAHQWDLRSLSFSNFQCLHIFTIWLRDECWVVLWVNHVRLLAILATKKKTKTKKNRSVRSVLNVNVSTCPLHAIS